MKPIKFNFKTFLISTSIVGVFTLLTLFAAVITDEGTDRSGIIIITLARLFHVFRFPTHTLFFDFMNGIMFFMGLITNCFLYGFFIERMYWVFIINRTKKYWT